MKHSQASTVIALIVTLFCAGASLPATAQSGPTGSSSAARGQSRQQQSFPDQSSVAAKKAFSMLPASNGALKKALSASDLTGAGKLVGKNGSFQGTVSQVYSPRDHDIAILDFAQNYRSAITAIVMPSNYSKLPDLNGLVGKQVLITGKFSSYEGRAQLEITSVKQVKVIH